MTDTTSAAQSEREQFEAWVRGNYGRFSEPSLVRSPDGYAHAVAHDTLPSTYANLQMLWEAWQAARRANPTPPAVVEPLTGEQIAAIWAQKPRYHAAPIGKTDIEFARAIERAHGIT